MISWTHKYRQLLHMSFEVMWWVVVLVGATLLGLVWLTTPVAGRPVADIAAPRVLPDIGESWELGVCYFRAGDFANAAAVFDELAGAAEADLGLAVWIALSRHSINDAQGALHVWQAVDLSPETAVYRDLALAAGWLEQGRFEPALAALDRAEHLAANHPLLHYYVALAELSLADDELPDESTWMCCQASGYVTSAIRHLQAAVTSEFEVDLGAPLMPSAWTAEPALGPTVGDLLMALRADRFVATAHHILGQLLRDRGELRSAEKHLDEAARLGTQSVLGYYELGASYEVQGQFFDAARAQAKAWRQDPDDDTLAARLLVNEIRGLWAIMAGR